jgi:hypothetical protein
MLGGINAMNVYETIGYTWVVFCTAAASIAVFKLALHGFRQLRDDVKNGQDALITDCLTGRAYRDAQGVAVFTIPGQGQAGKAGLN